MNRPIAVKALEELGRVRLLKHFFMRDFLYSEISQVESIPNVPDYPDKAVEAGRQLCEQLLEPTGAFRSPRHSFGLSQPSGECQRGGEWQPIQLRGQREKLCRSHLGLPG